MSDAQRMGQAVPAWQCAVRKAGLTDPPQDCNWPYCGCDPTATKVLDALEEDGHKLARIASEDWQGLLGLLAEVRAEEREACVRWVDVNAAYWDEPGRLSPVERAPTVGALRGLARELRANAHRTTNSPNGEKP